MSFSEEEQYLLEADTNLLTDDDKIKKNQILINNNLNISLRDQKIFQKLLKNKISTTHDFISKSKKHQTNSVEEIEKKKEKIKHLIKIISDNTGLEAKLIEQTVEDVDIHLDDKMLIRSIFKLLSMRSSSNSLNLTACIKNNASYPEEFHEVLEELEKERQKIYQQTIFKEFSDLTGMSIFIIQEGLKLKDISLDFSKEKEDLILELKKNFNI